MSQETEEKDYGFNDLFEFDQDKFEKEEEVDLSEFDGLENFSQEEEAEQEQEQEEGAEEQEEGDDNIDFENIGKDEEEEGSDIDLEAFNKKMDTDFKTDKELREFLKGKDKEDGAGEEVNEEDDIDKAQKTIDLYEPILNLNDEALMREELKALAVRDKKDLTDEDVLEQIEEEIQDMIDSRVLDIKADRLREKLEAQVVNPAREKITKHQQKQEQQRIAQEAEAKETVQETLAEIYKDDNFFGIQTDKERLAKVYKQVNSGEFIQQLQSDKKVQARVAAVYEYLSEIGKKAGGPSHSDGIKAVLNEFDTTQKKTGSNSFAKAQKKGSSGGGDGMMGLIADLTFDSAK